MKPVQNIEDIKKVPFFSQFTTDQIKTQLLKNAAQLRATGNRAKLIGKKIGGLDAAGWIAKAEHFDKLAAS